MFSCLCWDGSTSLHGKARYPYTEAARLSTRLWHALTRARVALTITTSQEAGDQALDKFRAELTSEGASVVVRHVTDPGCVLSSQVFPGQNFKTRKHTEQIFDYFQACQVRI